MAIQKEIVSREGVGKEAEIYTRRFSEREDALRSITWDILVPEFLQVLVDPSSTVIDLGAGDGLFIKRIQARRRIAVDLSSHVMELKNFGVEVYQIPADKMSTAIPAEKSASGVISGDKIASTAIGAQGIADVVFMSNFLEHLPDKAILLRVLEECRRVIKPNGRVIILQPNVRYVGSRYWDYIDHHIALTEHSLAEALDISGFRIEKMIPRFLPYTAKSRLGNLVASLGLGQIAVRSYLRFPLIWKIFGAQTFVVATPR